MPRARAKKAPTEIEQIRAMMPVLTDSYQNIPARLGTGAPNLVNSLNYPINRLTEDYPLILSLYRGSWVVRKIIDQVATDMYKSFPMLDTELSPEQVAIFHSVLTKTKTVNRLRSACKWGRLFGGAGAIMVIDGHNDLSKPLELEEIEVGSYKGLIVLDRWSGIIPGPEINSDIDDPESFGLPTYYTCIMDAGNVQVHHSRILRFTGRELPQWEVQVELYWGQSEVEVIFDELKKRDYSSWNIVSLLTRAQVMCVSEPQLATLMSGAGGSNDAFNAFVQRMEMISQQLNNNGLMILGKEGKLENKTYGFGGISDVYHEFMKDLAAATGIPYEVIFGRENGMGDLTSNTGGSMQLYDNFIEEKRVSEANPVIDKFLPVICQSTFGEVPEDLIYHWTPIRAISDKEKSDLGKSLVESILMAYNADLITKREARSELANQSGTNGLFAGITRESIAATPDMYASEAMMEAAFNLGEGESTAGGVPVGQDPEKVGGQRGGGDPKVEGKGGGKAEREKRTMVGSREGETVPVESKPVGVKGLVWHKARRLDPEHIQKKQQALKAAGGLRTFGAGGATGTGGANSSTTAKSIEQTMQHSIKHHTKKPKKQAADEALDKLEEPMLCPSCESGDCMLHMGGDNASANI